MCWYNLLFILWDAHQAELLIDELIMWLALCIADTGFKCSKAVNGNAWWVPVYFYDCDPVRRKGTGEPCSITQPRSVNAILFLSQPWVTTSLAARLSWQAGQCCEGWGKCRLRAALPALRGALSCSGGVCAWSRHSLKLCPAVSEFSHQEAKPSYKRVCYSAVSLVFVWNLQRDQIIMTQAVYAVFDKHL